MGRTSGPDFIRQVLWAPLYESVLNILGTTGIIIPLADANDENSGRTTVTTRGEIQAVFTYSEAVTSFDTPPTFEGPAEIPRITFNGTDEEADSPSVAYWSRIVGVLSMGAWINLVDATSSAILTKFDNTGNTREWVFGSNTSDFMTIFVYDEDAVGNASLDTTTNDAVSQGVWVFCVATYDGSANATGLNIYTDGVLAASTDTDDANFINLEALGGTVKLAHLNASPGSLFDGSMAGGPLGPFFVHAELTADQILRLYQLGRVALGV